MKRILWILMLCCLALTMASCGESGEEDGRLSVVTTSFPPYDFARAIAGENIRLTMLIDPGTETHTYDPTPRDIRTVRDCDIFICGGGESDTWVKEVLASVDTSEMVILSMCDIVELMEEETVEGMTTDHPHEPCEDPDHEHVAYDEHVWTSPANAAAITEAILDTLIQAEPEREALYRQNGEAYIAAIRQLSADFAAVRASAALDTVVFADRFPFLYFVREFDLHYRAAFPGCAEKTEPGAQTIAYLIDYVKTNAIPAVFYTEFSNRQMAGAIAEATGVKQLLFHSCHNVSKADFDAGVTYVSLMRQNLTNLREALGQ